MSATAINSQTFEHVAEALLLGLQLEVLWRRYQAPGLYVP